MLLDLDGRSILTRDLSAPCRCDQAKRRLEKRVASDLFRFRKTKQPEFHRGAAAAKANRHATIRKQIGNRRLLGNRQRVMQVQANDGSAQMNAFRLAREMESQKQGAGKMPEMRVCVMLREPRVLKSQLISHSRLLGDRLVDFKRRRGCRT